MRIHDITLKNIGPFEEAYLEFIGSEDSVEKPPVIIITGENGAGKTIIIDAIRSLFYGAFNKIERDIRASKSFFLIKSNISFNENESFTLKSDEKSHNSSFATNNMEFNKLFHSGFRSKYEVKSIVNFWTSRLSSDKFEIKGIEAPDTGDHMTNALTGIHKNIEVTKLICYFDYLRDSKDKFEKKNGEVIFDILKKIIDISLTKGKLSHISRAKLEPIISINNRQISLDKLSSGNLYLIQRFVFVLKQMYSVCINHDIPTSNIQQIPGLLLIDEAENHLHPKWQKKFLTNLLEIFPNLQIILSTHSPFIVSSIKNSRIFVCSNSDNYSIVKEETDYYNNKPIEEILLSSLFDTNNFNLEISELLRRRKTAIESKNIPLKKEIESKLIELNPGYFNYFNIEELIDQIKK